MTTKDVPFERDEKMHDYRHRAFFSKIKKEKKNVALLEIVKTWTSMSQTSTGKRFPMWEEPTGNMTMKNSGFQ